MTKTQTVAHKLSTELYWQLLKNVVNIKVCKKAGGDSFGLKAVNKQLHEVLLCVAASCFESRYVLPYFNAV